MFHTHQLYYKKRIGLTGVMCNTKEMTAFQKLIIIDDPNEGIRKAVGKLKWDSNDQVNLIIVASHCGYVTDIELARKSRDIHVIVGGHSGTFLYKGDPGSAVVEQQPQGEYPTAIQNLVGELVYIVHASHATKYVGKFEIDYGKQIVYYCWGNPVLMDQNIVENERVRQILAKHRPSLAHFHNTIVGISHIVMEGYQDNCKIRECNIGNLVADAMAFKIANLTGTSKRWSVSGASIINGGAIATGIRTPSITHSIKYRDLSKALPYQNCIHILKMTGDDLMKALEHSVSDHFFHGSKLARSQFLQVSGIRVVYDLNRRSGRRIISVAIRCGFCTDVRYQKLDSSRIYYVGMTDYLALKGDGYTMFDIDTVQDHFYKYTRLDLLETVREFMVRQELVEPIPQERIVLIRTKNKRKKRFICICRIKCLYFRQHLKIQRRVLRDTSDPFQMPDKNFIKHFRLSKELTMYLINELRPFLRNGERSTAISIEKQILSCLLFFAHGSYQSCIGGNFNLGLSQQAMSKCLSNITNAIVENLLQTWIVFPQTEQERNNVKQGFLEKFDFPGVIGAIDCTHVAIIAPPMDYLIHPGIAFYNRKGFYSINVQLICDSNLRILNCNTRFPGSSHDAAIWSLSTVNMHLQELYRAEALRSSWLIGDSGYSLQPWLLTPITDAAENTPEGRYNRTHIAARNCIERCNGVLKQRFRCLLQHRVLHYDPIKAGKIILCCAVLHNMALQVDSFMNLDEPQVNNEENRINDANYNGMSISNKYVENVNVFL
ncbi:nucleotidase-related [Holotrichia oblita]|uniref:Nucleotidase-related n=1 Tax=Holotrichia oblita TaxID=644536 RepID=A0ACB9TJ39_HOLOL|nr:nucleotidase-related [Holotrichia oblita]